MDLTLDERSRLDFVLTLRRRCRIGSIGASSISAAASEAPTWPLKRRFPEAEVIGLDLAEPCLRLAYIGVSGSASSVRGGGLRSDGFSVLL